MPLHLFNLLYSVPEKVLGLGGPLLAQNFFRHFRPQKVYPGHFIRFTEVCSRVNGQNLQLPGSGLSDQAEGWNRRMVLKPEGRLCDS